MQKALITFIRIFNSMHSIVRFPKGICSCRVRDLQGGLGRQRRAGRIRFARPEHQRRLGLCEGTEEGCQIWEEALGARKRNFPELRKLVF